MSALACSPSKHLGRVLCSQSCPRCKRRNTDASLLTHSHTNLQGSPSQVEELNAFEDLVKRAARDANDATLMHPSSHTHTNLQGSPSQVEELNAFEDLCPEGTMAAALMLDQTHTVFLDSCLVQLCK